MRHCRTECDLSRLPMRTLQSGPCDMPRDGRLVLAPGFGKAQLFQGHRDASQISSTRSMVSLHRVSHLLCWRHLKYREYVCVPAVSHLQHPVKTSSPGGVAAFVLCEPCEQLRSMRSDTLSLSISALLTVPMARPPSIGILLFPFRSFNSIEQSI